MTRNDTQSSFKAKLLSPAGPNNDAWAFVVLPKAASKKLPRRGRTTVDAKIDGYGFQATLEPDGQLSHWLRLDEKLLKDAAVKPGEIVTFEIVAVDQEPEPELPPDLEKALEAAAEAKRVWSNTTPVARLDWIHWITSAKQAKTRAKRIENACEMLTSGKRRVCCFDPSGFYSKAFSAPKTKR